MSMCSPKVSREKKKKRKKKARGVTKKRNKPEGVEQKERQLVNATYKR